VKRYKNVDDYIDSTEHWQDELRQLRKILNSTRLEETVKWGGPCYTFDGKNLVGMGAFKSYVGLWFFQGALLTDPLEVLINAQEGKTKVLRQWRFEAKKEIKTRLIKTYVNEAISLQEEGLEIKAVRGRAVVIPSLLQAALSKNKRANAGFKKLTPGKQREYAGCIAEAKREETKVKRLAKTIPMIVAGKGLNDKYRTC